MENLKIFKKNNIDLLKLNNPYFYDRLYFSLKEDGVNIQYGDFCSRIMKNGAVLVLKSLGIYLIKGARNNKLAYIHPKLELIINTTIASNDIIADTTIKLVNGNYSFIEKFNINDLSKFMSLNNDYPHSVDSSKCTYIIYNKTNNLSKIGRSNNVYDRLNTLRNQISPDLELLAYNNFDVEGKLHKEYNKFRIFGEWFDLKDDDILDIKNKYNFTIIQLQSKH